MKNINTNKRTQFVNIDRQKGWTIWSLMFILGILMLFSYIGFQLVPVYSGNSSVVNAMQIAIDGVSPNSVRRKDVIYKMNAQLNLDGGFGSIDYKNALDIKRTQRELLITVKYERRVELFYNLSLVAEFDNEVKRDL